MNMFIKLVFAGLKRRKREMRYISAAAFIAVLFMSSVTLFQTIMDRYLMETNYQNYGDWVMSAVKDYKESEFLFSELNHPYFASSGVCVTGTELLNEDREPANVWIGAADENLLQFGNISLYEGRFPVAEDEIVMDLSSLSALGLSYEPGQTVPIAFWQDDTLIEKEFLLTGTIKSFALNWKHNSIYPLPNCLVTEEALKKLCKPSHASYFYQLDRTYEDLNMEEFTSAFIKPNHLRIYNSYVYENRVWGSKELFLAVKLLLTLIGALAMGYLMMSYTAGRRKWYYKLRCMGADKLQIKLMILAEAIYGTFLSVFFGMILPYAAGAAICFGLSKSLKIPYFFTFHPKDFFGQMGTVFAIILFSVLCAWIKSRDRNLGRNSSEITKRQIKRLRKDTRKERNTAGIFFRRQRKLHPAQGIAYILFSFLVCLILTMCLNKICQSAKEFQLTKESFHDFHAEKDTSFIAMTPNKNGNGTGGGDLPWNMYDGISSQTEQEIESLIGIKQINWKSQDNLHILQWENKKDSPIEQRAKELYENDITHHSFTQFSYYKDDRSLLKNLKQDFDLKELNEDAFLKGEEIVLMLSSYEGSFDTSENRISETTLHPGDTVEIVSIEDQTYVPITVEGFDKLPGRVPVKIGAIITEPPLKWKTEGGLLAHYNIFASEKLAERVAKADNKTLFHNDFTIDLNSTSSFEATEKRLTDIFNQNDLDYTTNSEELTEARNIYIRNLCIYGVLLCTILFIFLLLQIHFHQLQNQYRKREYRLFKQLGMEWSFFLRMTIKENVGQSLFLLLSIPCSYGIMAGTIYLNYKKDQETSGLFIWSDSLNDYTSDLYRLTVDQLQNQTELKYTVVFVLLLITAFVLTACLSMNQLKKEELQ